MGDQQKAQALGKKLANESLVRASRSAHLPLHKVAIMTYLVDNGINLKAPIIMHLGTSNVKVTGLLMIVKC